MNEYFLNVYFGFCFELNFELNHFLARFNGKMNFQNVSPRAKRAGGGGRGAHTPKKRLFLVKFFLHKLGKGGNCFTDHIRIKSSF